MNRRQAIEAEVGHAVFRGVGGGGGAGGWGRVVCGEAYYP